jgi:hypothetical protein
MFNIRRIETTTYNSIQEFIKNEDFMLRIGILSGFGFELTVCHQDPVSKEVSNLGSIKIDSKKFQKLFIPDTEPAESFNFDEKLVKQYLIENAADITPFNND